MRITPTGSPDHRRAWSTSTDVRGAQSNSSHAVQWHPGEIRTHATPACAADLARRSPQRRRAASVSASVPDPISGHAAVRRSCRMSPGGDDRDSAAALPGDGSARVVLAAHVDRHAPAERALGNATGGAVSPALAPAPRPVRRRCARADGVPAQRGGRGVYRLEHPAGEHARPRAAGGDLSLDTVVDCSQRTAPTSGLPGCTTLCTQRRTA